MGAGDDLLRDIVLDRFGVLAAEGAMNRTRVILVALLLYASCIRLQRPQHPGLLRTAPPSPRCRSLSSRVLWLNLTGVVSGGIGGGTGTAAGVFDQPIAKYTLGGAALVFSLTGVVTGYLATWYAATFARECP